MRFCQMQHTCICSEDLNFWQIIIGVKLSKEYLHALRCKFYTFF